MKMLKSVQRAEKNAAVDIVFTKPIPGKYSQRIRGPAPDFTLDGNNYRSNKLETMVRKGVAFIDPDSEDKFYINKSNMVVFRAEKTKSEPPVLRVFDVFRYQKSKLRGKLVEKTSLASHF